MSRPKLRGRKVMDRLKVRIEPCGFAAENPSLVVFSGTHPVLTAYVDLSGSISGWLTSWGVYGNETTDDNVTESDVRELMGWKMP